MSVKRMSNERSCKRARCDPEPSEEEWKEIRRQTLLRCIEHQMSKFVKLLSAGDPLVLSIPNRCWQNSVYDECIRRKPRGELVVNRVKFAHKQSQEKFAVIVHLLSSVYVLLTRRQTSTKRELFYQDKALFGNKQSKVDNAINDICCLLGASPWDLGIIPTSKGLVAGHLRLVTADDEDVDCMKAGGVLIPQDVQGIKSITSMAHAIILVEKDAAFQKLLDDGIFDYPWVIVTGKGVPDVNTRMMVKKLWQTLQVPVYALVDADPYGIEIMCTYRFGSLELAHLADLLATPAIRWLGVYPSDIDTYKVPAVPVTQRDVAKLKSLLARPYTQAIPGLQKEIQYMLDNNEKAEIEAIHTVASQYLARTYIQDKIRYVDCI